MLIFLLTLLIFILVVEEILNQQTKLYNARFLTQTEKKTILKKPLKITLWQKFKDWLYKLFIGEIPTRGFAFGTDQLSMEASTTHCAVIAQTGSGKTSKFVLPTLLLNPEASFFITDSSGELYEKSSGWLRKQGYSTQVLDFREGATHSHSYNRLSGDISPAKLKEICELLFDTAYSNTSGSTENSQFWRVSSLAPTFCSLWLLTLQNKKYNNLTNLRALLQRFLTSPRDIHHMILQTGNSELLREYEAVISADPKVLQNSISTALTALDKFSNPHLSALTSVSNLDLSLLRKEKSALFIILPEGKVKQFAQVSALLFDEIVEVAKKPKIAGEPYNPILFILEEAANVGILQGNFPQVLTTIRKYQVGIAIVLQSISQLYNAVGKANAETILGNCLTKLYLSGLDDVTAQSLVKRYGQTVAQYHNIEGILREGVKPLLTIDQILTLPTNFGLFQHKNFRPGLFSIDSVYQNSTLKKRMKVTSDIYLPKIPKKVELLPIKKIGKPASKSSSDEKP